MRTDDYAVGESAWVHAAQAFPSRHQNVIRRGVPQPTCAAFQDDVAFVAPNG